MKLKVYIKGFVHTWLYRHCRRYKEKIDRQADEYFAVEQMVE